MPNFDLESLEMHRAYKGKIKLSSKVSLQSTADLSRAYTPGVAAPCLRIQEHPEEAYEMTIKGNSVAVVSDGSAVLGLGNIGPLAGLPVMEGKALLFRAFGGVDAWPLCLDTQDPLEIAETVRRIAPSFGGINLEDIAAPACFAVEEALEGLGIPVFHDDQQGTAIVTLAALINAAKVVGKSLDEMRIVISGAGAAGISVARLLAGRYGSNLSHVAEVILCDSKGVISSQRLPNLPSHKQELLEWTNPRDVHGTLHQALVGADVFVGVSKANLFGAEQVASMAGKPIILAMANPHPEIMPSEALKGGAAVIATGRSDFPNQVNNVLVFPGMFRGALDQRIPSFTGEMYLAAAQALAALVSSPSPDCIIPRVLDPSNGAASAVARAVAEVHQRSLAIAGN